MIERPHALGMLLCDQVIIEAGSKKPSLIGIFTSIRCDRFPSIPKPMSVFASLTNGIGRVELTLLVSSLKTGKEIAGYTGSILFDDPLKVANYSFHLRSLTFDEPGVCLFELSSGGESICHRRVQIYG